MDGSATIEPDASIEASVYYDSCMTQRYVPTMYPRLVEVYCIDTNGKSNFIHYYDSQLNLNCSFKTTSDFKFRCAPLNEQSGPEYSDPLCRRAIAFAKLDSPPYIGIYTEVDAGNYIEIYSRGNSWNGSTIYYKLIYSDGNWDCLEMGNLNLKMFSLGEIINPSIFVEQWSFSDAGE